jgi:hypothetical protein
MHLVVHFHESRLYQELATKLTFDQPLINKFVNEIKVFIKNYVLGIENYDLKQYGSLSELDLSDNK